MNHKLLIPLVFLIAAAHHQAVGQTLPTVDIAAAQLPTVRGTLGSLVKQLTGDEYFLDHPDTDPRPYLEPSHASHTLHRAGRHLAGGNIEQAAELAQQVDYELVRFVDEKTDHDYLLLRENLDVLTEPRGWGSYLFNPKSDIPALVEAPHPLDDSNSAKVAAMVFARGARGLLIAGAQRDKADVPDLVDSVFHQMHVAWSGVMGQVAVWQIHGFAIEKHPFPRNAKAILSTGGGEVVDEIVKLDDRLANRGIEGYVYNRLNAENKLNKWVNGGTPGLRFSSLAATKNEQGKHLRSLGGTFVHVELERAIRKDPKQRRVAAEAIAEAIEESVQPPKCRKPKRNVQAKGKPKKSSPA